MFTKFLKPNFGLIEKSGMSNSDMDLSYIAYILLTLVVSIVFSYLVRFPLEFFLSILFKSKPPGEKKLFIEKLIGPIQIFVATFTFLLINLSFQESKTPKTAIIIGTKLAFFIALTYMAYRIIDILFCRAINRHNTYRSKIALVLPLGRRVTKTILLVTALLFLLAQFGVDVSALLVGLGVGSLAIALAAQKILENLFGGAVLSLDQPFQVGDYCRCGDILGYIEEIGIRSTRIRTLDRTLVSVPNSSLSQVNIENYNEREKIRLCQVIKLKLSTKPEQLREVIKEFTLIIESNPDIFYQDSYRVKLITIGESSYDIEVYAFTKTTDYVEFLTIKQNFFFDALAVLRKLKVSLAIPERRIHSD